MKRLKITTKCELAALGCILSPEEEQELFRIYRKGLSPIQAANNGVVNDSPEGKLTTMKQAEAKIVEAYQPLVRSMALKKQKQYIGYTELDDLVSAGNLGLLKALPLFDPQKGFRFGTFARWWILDKINEQVRFDRWPRHIPYYMFKSIRNVANAIGTLHSKRKRRPRVSEIAQFLKIPESRVRRVIAWKVSDDVSLDIPVGDDGESTLAEFIRDDQRIWDTTSPDPLERRNLDELVANALHTLDPLEEKIVKMTFGFLSESETNDIRTEFSQSSALTKERVWQLKAGAIRKLRESRRSLLGGYHDLPIDRKLRVSSARAGNR